jgi:hypothetical protein
MNIPLAYIISSKGGTWSSLLLCYFDAWVDTSFFHQLTQLISVGVSTPGGPWTDE